jgi:hypothetical protein
MWDTPNECTLFRSDVWVIFSDTGFEAVTAVAMKAYCLAGSNDVYAGRSPMCW